MRDYIRGAAGAAAHLSCFRASFARGCVRDYSFEDGKSSLAVVIIDTLTSLHLPAFGTKPMGRYRGSWNTPSALVVFAKFDSGLRDHAGPGPRHAEMGVRRDACSHLLREYAQDTGNVLGLYPAACARRRPCTMPVKNGIHRARRCSLIAPIALLPVCRPECPSVCVYFRP